MRHLFLSLLAATCVACADGSQAPQRGPSGDRALGDLLQPERVLYDEAFVVDAGGMQMRAFRLNRDADALITVEGRADAAKGFSVYLIDPAGWEAFSAGRDAKTYPDWRGVGAVEYRERHRLAAGEYAVVVHNSQNILRALTVSLRVVINPSG